MLGFFLFKLIAELLKLKYFFDIIILITMNGVIIWQGQEYH